MQHSLQLQLQYLRKALEQDKRPIGFLIGAGAAMSLKNADGKSAVPDLSGLTEQVKKKLGKEGGALIDELINDLANPKSTLEDLLSYIRLLTALPGTKEVRGYDLVHLRLIDHEICKIVRSIVDVPLPEGRNPYQSLAIWAGSANRDMPVEIFTTNYDLLTEQALESQHIAYFDGFIGSYKPLFDLEAMEEDSIPRRWVRLWKLHGSINWQRSGNKIWRGAQGADDDEAVLIYPSHLKYDQSRRLPYLAMIDRLRRFMKQPNAILISIGFSFGDQHLNEVLTQALRGNQTASIQGLMYSVLDKYQDAVAMAESSPNFTVLTKDGAVVGTRKGVWIPEKKPETGESIPVEFTEGDFEMFGNLLIEMVGNNDDEPVSADDVLV